MRTRARAQTKKRRNIRILARGHARDTRRYVHTSPSFPSTKFTTDRRYRENSRWPSVHHAPLHPLSLRSQSVVRACCCAHQMTKTCSLAPVSVWLVLLQTQKRAESFCQFALAAAWLPRGVLTVRFAIPLCRQSPWRHYRFVDWPGLERALGLHAHWCKAALVALQSRSS